MIIVKLKGGLGNQMFQYAFARKLSLMKNIQVKFDISHFDNDKVYNRHYELNHFNIIENIASPEEVNQFIYGKFERGLSGLALKFIDKVLPNHRRRVVKQPKKGFDPLIYKVSDNTYIDGYWGNEEYFKDIARTVRKEFTLRKQLDDKNLAIKNKIMNVNSVSIHIRRGDYLNVEGAKRLFPVCSIEYYENAIQRICSIVDNPQFFIFTDDYDWVENNITHKVQIIIVKNSEGYKDFDLMKNCKHDIIANSTFSWWSAWLNENPDKIVIAPKIWYKVKSYQKMYEKGNLVPKEWIKL